ncbi:MAG: hypothetical protein CVT95_11700, partial [Bacteroidetes bacterium HGW-Bacteroidetes-12]
SFLFSQNIDAILIANNKFDSIIHGDANSFDFLFYKHKDDVLMSNLGVYNSLFYFPIASGVYNENHFFKKKHIRIFNLIGTKPFSNISYVNASRKEQLFSIYHQQQFGKALDFGFYLNKTSSSGEYVNQAVNTSDFDVFLNFINKANTYRLKLNFDYKRLKQQENGGISNKSEFEENLFVSPLSATINLQNSRDQTTSYFYAINQSLDIYKIKNNKFYMLLNSTYSSDERMFYDNDPLSSIYNDIFIDTLNTIDSIFSTSFDNEFGFGLRNNKQYVSVSASHSFNNYFQSFGLDTSYTNSFVGGAYQLKDSVFRLDFKTKYGFQGYRKGDFYNELRFSYMPIKNVTYNFHGSYFLSEPNLKTVNYTSNHFEWRNYDFSKQTVSSLRGSVLFNKYQLELLADIKLLDNAIYYNTFSVVTQHDNPSSMTTFSVSKKYRLYKFHFKTALFYQTTSNDYLFPLPEFIGRQLVYYEATAFKKVLRFQFGFNVSYNSAYYGYAYMPALTEFYIQNKQQIGDYPYVDVFLNMHLKKAQIFLKYEHINSGWNGYDFYATAGYPALTRSLKFGVSWNLVD